MEVLMNKTREMFVVMSINSRLEASIVNLGSM